MSTASPESMLYRRVWRWHFYAGLICLPFLLLLAITGALYLYKDAIESRVYSQLRSTGSSSAAVLDAETLVARAQAAQPGTPTRFVAPPQPGRSAEVGIRRGDGVQLSVYLDPASGEVLGQLQDDNKLMEWIKHLHSLALAGPIANHWIEIVAGWAIVLVMTGGFLWWPRGRSGGVTRVRGRPAQRVWWRDLHAIIGSMAALAILFLAVTGMPWSAFWGAQFSRLSNEWGIGLPRYLFAAAPSSTLPLSSLGEVPWALSGAPLPESNARAEHDQHVEPGGHVGHGGHGDHAVPANASDPTPAGPSHTAHALSMGLNQALHSFTRLGLPIGTPVRLPKGERGVYTAMRFPDDVRGQRVVHLDRYSGKVLADVSYADYGIAGRVSSWGIALHTGNQFGWLNRLVMLLACLSIIFLSLSGVVMWWKRRPRGRLAAPPRRAGDRAALGALATALLLALLYPLLGASMLVALLVDALVPQRWHERFGF